MLATCVFGDDGRPDQEKKDGAARAVCGAGGTDGAAQAGGSMAGSVTRHAGISEEGNWRVLACGVDTLYASLHIDWGVGWERLLATLEKGKQKARGTEGLPFLPPTFGRCLILPSGKPPRYAYCLQSPEFRLYIGIQKTGRKTSNGYVAFTSDTLRRLGVNGAVARVKSLIHDLGGIAWAVKPSRCDLALDVHIPGGLTVAFLEEYGVGRSDKVNVHKEAGRLETFYVGAKGRPVLLRIYDKAREIGKSGKGHLREEWAYDGPDVWRIEYQLRRKLLQDFRVHSIEDLTRKLGGIWKYLTGEWFSLRYPDNDNASRRAFFKPWADVVQASASRFGEVVNLKRCYQSDCPEGTEWYVSHSAGCMVSYAACKGISDPEEAGRRFLAEILSYWQGHDFAGKYAVRRIQRGKDAGGRTPDGNAA